MKYFVLGFFLLCPAAANASAQDFQCYGTEYVGDLERFRMTKMNEIIKNGFSPGVFQHTGGGPNGEHWNMSGIREGVFCAAAVPTKSDDLGLVTVTVGPTPVPVQVKPEDGSGDRLFLSPYHSRRWSAPCARSSGQTFRHSTAIARKKSRGI